ncbi:hypothetical protein QVN42_01955 [Yersinia nurmii]|uniref:Lipoprotein n=1 Tax=Yersinia nurmii TaxID=685706 RepID=A0AAW7JTA6_9GAMM|nr:hypothetical protein [Yersinia nurmii]MDN0086167.1 hypothetical protein [Yersinia nurmii]CND82704.1 putative lipoprotein [Yersinia nurmii]
MKTSHKLLISFICVAALSGCARTAPVLTPYTNITTHNSTEQIKTIILDAGQNRDWIMTPIAPGVIDGRLMNRDHSVNIRINYTPTNYTIKYVSSTNLKAANGKIHRNYNRWVNNLDKDIQKRLMANANK